MMKEINQQSIEAFVLQYHGIECVKMKFNRSLWEPLKVFYKCNLSGHSFIQQFEYIELRSIESLTDEESSDLGDILQTITPENFIDHIKNNHSYLKNAAISLEAFDYLREIGIAVPFRGVSEEEMIESGKLKLKDK